MKTEQSCPSEAMAKAMENNPYRTTTRREIGTTEKAHYRLHEDKIAKRDLVRGTGGIPWRPAMPSTQTVGRGDSIS